MTYNIAVVLNNASTVTAQADSFQAAVLEARRIATDDFYTHGGGGVFRVIIGSDKGIRQFTLRELAQFDANA